MIALRLLSALAALALSGLPTTPAHAEEGQASGCNYTITALPHAIAAPGTYCIDQDLAASADAGDAITVAVDGAVVDCKGHRVDGLAAGAGTTAYGVVASGRRNVTVRNCRILGFQQGIRLAGDGGGHVVENNHVERSTHTGILVAGDGSVVRGNEVSQVGGSTLKQLAYGINASGVVDLLDNTIAGVAAGGDANAYGIYASQALGASINGNRIRDVLRAGTKVAYGIYATGAENLTLRGNEVVGDASAGSTGIRCAGNGNRVRETTVSGFETALRACGNAGGNSLKD